MNGVGRRDLAVTLCMRLPGDPNHGIKPLAAAEWSELARVLDTGADVDAAARQLRMQGRFERLEARRPRLELELDRLDDVGIGMVVIGDPGYPPRWRERLGALAPPLVAVAGALPVPDGSIAVTGWRGADAASLAWAGDLGSRAAGENRLLVTGGGDGIDQAATTGARAAGGRCLAILAEPLERLLREAEVRRAVAAGYLTLATPWHPAEAASPGNAIGRNRLIYSLAEWAVVVACGDHRGGTWHGATEALDYDWAPLFVRGGPAAAEGNVALLGYRSRSGAHPHAVEALPIGEPLGAWFTRIQRHAPPLADVLQASLDGQARRTASIVPPEADDDDDELDIPPPPHHLQPRLL